MRLPRPWRLLLGAAVLLVLVLGAYAGYLAWTTARSLTAAADEARTLRTAIASGDDDAIDVSFQHFAELAARAESRTDSPVWSLLMHAPAYGDDARGVRVVSRAAADLSTGGVQRLAHRAGELDALLPGEGGVDVRLVRSLQQPVADGHAALARAQEQLAGEDTSGYVGPLRDKYRDLEEQVTAAATALGVADRALRVLPDMSGADGERRYLLVMQSNAEIRSTGGLPGAVSLVTAHGGRLTMSKQLAGSALGEAPSPVLPLSEDETDLFGEQLGTYFVDANFTPDFPRTAALMRARWAQVQGDRVDGVVSVDPVALSYLLRATGPVQVGGTTLSADNVVDELLHDVYVRIPEPDAEDAYFREVARAVFARLTSGGADRTAMLTALRQGAVERRILIHDFHGADQEVLAGTPVAGELTPGRSDAPQVGIYLNDSTGAKMSYYLRYDAQVTATSCRAGVQSLSGHLTIRSTAPADAGTTLPAYVTGGGQYGVDAGTQIVNVQIYGPAGGTVDAIRTDGATDEAQQAGSLDGRPVRQIWVLLEPGATSDVTWTMTSGPGQVGAPRLAVTPSVAPGLTDSVPGGACR